jgi:phosphoribosyl 1,2-cyclic phosphodiesterase
VAFRFTILGSSSSGNAAYLETPTTRILIDIGLSARQIRQRMLTLGRLPEGLNGILITHEHGDHVQGLAVLAGKLGIPIYCNRGTREALGAEASSRLTFRIFATGASFEIGDLTVESFSIPHDAQDPVGYVLRCGDVSAGFLTDLGHATRLVVERVKQVNVLVLEANHDMKLLQDDVRRPWSVKQRIASRHGHLCNDAAAEVAAQVAGSHLHHLFLGHLSRDCNSPELAEKKVRSRLEQVGAHHVQLKVASPDTPSGTIALGDWDLASDGAMRLHESAAAPTL